MVGGEVVALELTGSEQGVSSLTREQYDKVNEILQENGPDDPSTAPATRHVR